MLQVAEEDIGQEADIFVIASVNGKTFTKQSNGRFSIWNGDQRQLRPMFTKYSLAKQESVPVVTGMRNLKGKFRVQLAYMTNKGLIVSADPVDFEIE